MSENRINISGLDFTKLPDDFKASLEDDRIDKITAKTEKKLKEASGIENFSFVDGIDKTEAEYIITALDVDENDEINAEEMRTFLKNTAGIKEDDTEQMQQISNLISSAIKGAKDVIGIEDPKDSEDDTEGVKDAGEVNNQTDENQDTEIIEIKVQKWGSAPEEGNQYANDCLERIMKNTFPDLEPYSDAWYEKETEIMNANPQIYGDENGEGARKAIGGTGRRNAVLYDDETINIPKAKTPENEEDNPSGEVEGSENAGGADPENTNLPEKLPEDAKEAEEREDLGDGIEIASYTDDEGNVIGKRQFNGEDVIWESTIKDDGNGGTIETRSWTDSGDVEVINYDADGKEVSKNTSLSNGTTSSANYTYAEDGTKSGEITYFDSEGAEFAKGTIAYDENGGYSETTKHTSGEKEGKEVNISYTKAGIASSKIETDTDGSKKEIVYENGLPKSGKATDAEGTVINTREYEYNDDMSYTETTTDPVNNSEAIIHFNSEGEEVAKTISEKGENGEILKSVEYENGTPVKITKFIYSDKEGKVKSGEIIQEPFEGGASTKTEIYNKYDENGEITATCTVSYDEEGNQTGIEGDESIIAELDPEAAQPEDNNKGGEAGKKSPSEKTIENTDGTHTVIHYDENGNITDDKTYFANGKIQNSNEYEYTEDGILNKQTTTSYDAESSKPDKTTITEFQADGTTPKTKTINKLDPETGEIADTCTIHYDESGNQVGEIEGNADLLEETPETPAAENDEKEPEETAQPEIDLSQTAGSLEATPLTEEQLAALSNGEEITFGDYTLKKDGNVIKTIQKTEVEMNGVLVEAKVVLKEENPDTGIIKAYELNGNERRIKSEKTADDRTINYTYSTGTAGPVYDPEKKAIVESDEKITIQTVTNIDKDGTKLSERTYNYTDDKTKTIISETTSDGTSKQTARANAYIAALSDTNLEPSERGDILIKMLEDENINCSDLSTVLKGINKGKSKEEKISFADIIDSSYESPETYFGKLQTVIDRSGKKDVAAFLDAYKTYSKNGLSLMRDIQDRLSWGNETEALKGMIGALTKNIEADFDNDHTKAIAYDNDIKKGNQDSLRKIYDLLNSEPPQINEKEALDLLYFVAGGEPKELISMLREKSGIPYRLGDSVQEKYMEMMEQLIHTAMK